MRAALCAFLFAGCAAFSNVTPAERAEGYGRIAEATRAECKAYNFDRTMGLVVEVPRMAELCK